VCCQPGVETSLKSGSKVYRARLAFMNIKFVTKLESKLDDAVEHHIILTHIRRNLMQKTRSYSPRASEQLQAVCEGVLRENCTSAEELGLRARLQIELRKRQPHIFMSSPLLPVQEALAWRSRALAFRYKDWTAFRGVWATLLQHPGFERRRLAQNEAEAHIDRAWELLGGHWQHMQTKEQAAQSRRVLSRSDRLQRHFQWALQAFERHLRAESSALKRSATREVFARRRIHRERASWLREHWKHLTMNDLLHNPHD